MLIKVVTSLHSNGFLKIILERPCSFTQIQFLFPPIYSRISAVLIWTIGISGGFWRV